MKMQAETGVRHLPAKECQRCQPTPRKRLGESLGQMLPPHLRKNRPCHSLILDLWLPELNDRRLLFVELCVLHSSSPGKVIQGGNPRLHRLPTRSLIFPCGGRKASLVMSPQGPCLSPGLALHVSRHGAAELPHPLSSWRGAQDDMTPLALIPDPFSPGPHRSCRPADRRENGPRGLPAPALIPVFFWKRILGKRLHMPSSSEESKMELLLPTRLGQFPG